MGYYTRFHGGFSLSRELNNAEVKAVTDVVPEHNQFLLDVTTAKRNLPEGTLVSKSASSIYMPSEGEEAKWYDSATELAAIINALPEDVDVNGYVRAEGEDSGDIWRYKIERDHNGKRIVKQESPILTWPDGTTEGGRH